MSFLETLENLSFSTWVNESIVGYPVILLLHVLGMGVVVGISAVISLRLLGVASSIEVRPLERLYPLMWWGFGVNAVTGTALLLAQATTKLVDPVFYIKMVCIFAGITVLHRTRTRVFAHLGPDGTLPASAKGLAWAALICWLGAVTAGRLLAYI